ncbi:MAG: hypothetical protein ACLFSB_00985 [Chitinispirillaceae bacterium]
MKTYLIGIVVFILCHLSGWAQQPSASFQEDSSQVSQGYQIDKPGTITFTMGVKIKGKVEKPQVMIFLPKEKTWNKEMEFERSFKDDLMSPLPYSPQNE